MSDPAEVHPRELLSAYLDDELDVDERSKVDRHLVSCEDCRVQLSALGRLARAVAGEDVPPVPADLPERTGRRLDAATVVRSRRFGFVLPTSIAATIAALGILVAVQWRQGRIGETPLPVPEPKQAKQEAPATRGAAQPIVPPSPSAAAPPPARVAPLEDKSVDRLEKDEKRQVEPNQMPPQDQELEKAKADAVDGGVPGGVVGGVVGGVEAQRDAGRSLANATAERVDAARERDYANAPVPAPASPMLERAAKSALIVSPCAEHWSDSGVRGSLTAPELLAAVSDLTRIASGAGGAAIWRGASDERIVLTVPRDRFDDVLRALRARGVAGLPERQTLAMATGDDCAGIFVVLSAPTQTP
jgi:hypothetical protein